MDIQTPAFQGPLDLLLDLIEKRKMHISTVALADVASIFLEKVKNMDMSPEQTAHFISVIATLVYLKSQSLVKDIVFSDEEEDDIEVLKKRVELLKYIRQEVASNKMFTYTVRNPLQTRNGSSKKRIKVFMPDDSFTLKDLTEQTNTIETVSSEDIKKIHIKATMSLEQMKERVIGVLNKLNKASLHEFQVKEKQDIVVLFLALLELFKQNELSIEQEENFGILTIRK